LHFHDVSGISGCIDRGIEEIGWLGYDDHVMVEFSEGTDGLDCLHISEGLIHHFQGILFPISTRFNNFVLP